ncbi:OmpA family protein [Endozoicomonas gorgoniicola]|nr:OmpA family protein [Endozoicomonas gorgoniicola]
MGAAVEGSAAAFAGGTAVGALLGGLLCALTDKDSDADGVSDRYDLCKDTPPGVEVGESGCPVDSDNDGVPDHQDLCPDTPAGMTVNEHGCPIDSDGDGVPDGLDKCPNTMKGAPVDAQGCYLEVSENLGEIYFIFDKENLDDASRQLLDNVSQKMKDNPDLKLRVYGYTDNSGEPAYNVDLSQRRADTVRDYLVKQGISGDRIKPMAGGVILEHNNTPAGRASNRKASLVTGEEE